MKSLNFILCTLLFIIFPVSCSNFQTEMNFNNLKIEKLNINTLNFISNRCKISLKDSLEIPMKMNGIIINTYNEYFKFHLEKRKKLFYYLDSMNITYKNEFALFENYALDVHYLLSVDDNRHFFFQISNEGLVNFEEQIKNNLHQIDSTYCSFSNIGYGRFMLWSKFNTRNDSIETIALNNY